MSRTCQCILGALKAIRPTSHLRSEPQSLEVLTRTSVRNYSSSQSTNPAILQRQWSRQNTLWSSRSPCILSQTRAEINVFRKAQRHSTRSFSNSTPRYALKTVQEVEARNRGGPFSIVGALLFIASGVGLWVYFQYEKERMARKRIAEATKGMGRPKVGGEFDLVDHEGKRFTHENLQGKYALVYFGFSHCPDICPDELDKMAIMIDRVKERCGNVILPVMISCDPARDTPEVLKEYLKEFHPDIIGLTGTWENVKSVCKAYRVYFSTPPHVKPGQDYLVDHSIYFYLMDPEGDFVEAIGRNFTAEQAAKVISDHIKDWNGPLNKKDYWA